IWTNDNLVALQSLLDERDRAGAYRYRAKVDLVYIDPPFMVNNDFRVDNAIPIDLDEKEGIEATKEPSLVEFIAYRDTWRNGLDSFLVMLRRRLELLKELLAPTGSIYVHLDWHAVHYVKVMMDELFGYENFQNEIVWKRTSSHADAKGFNAIHDTIICFSRHAPSAQWNAILAPHSIDYIKSHYNRIDEKTGRRYRLNDLRSPAPRPNMIYDWKGYKPHKNGWSISKEVMAEYDEKGLIYYPPNGERLAFKKFLDDDGVAVLSLWTDLPPVNSQALERLGYPTQKPVALLERIITASSPPGGCSSI
ncbi:MAG TPA: site-specific DNA-methyltransferase, partial [Kofleriaceae bacterium]|nr:site-specific DNA-methyltransferase [Kofleriaceae bacterium]